MLSTAKKRKLRNLLIALDPKAKSDIQYAELRETVTEILKRPREVLVKEIKEVVEPVVMAPTEEELVDLIKSAFPQEEIVSLIKSFIKEPEKVDENKLRNKILGEVLSRMPHGGNANRNIAIGSNASVLSKYTDINIKPGSNVTLSYANNDTTKYLDLTIAATGGAGTTRSVNNISTSQTAGDTALTDYVYIVSAGVALTLPTAVGNTNLYTIKNTSVSSVLVGTTGGETIDASANAILSTQYTSIDLISDGANWDIT